MQYSLGSSLWLRPFLPFVVLLLFAIMMGTTPALGNEPGAEAVEATDEPYFMHEFALCRNGLLGSSLKSRVVVLEPKSETPKANLLFLPGFGDVADNHFKTTLGRFADHGFRVISFDYPSHGKTKSLFPLGTYTMRGLGQIAQEVLQEYGRKGLPLVVAGWSTGGLLALRMLERGQFGDFDLKGLLLYTPAVSTPLLVGNRGFVTPDTLSSDPDAATKYSVRPKSPLYHPLFAISLLRNSWAAQRMQLPYELPVALFVAGDEDKYVNSAEVRAWGETQRKQQSALVWTHVFPGRKHMLDTEPQGNTAFQVGTIATNFADGVISGLISPKTRSAYESVHPLVSE